MTVIAYDGKSLAVDSLNVRDGQAIRNVIKWRRVDIDVVGDMAGILAIAGNYRQGLILMDWFESGMIKDEWPSFQGTEDWTDLILMTKAGAGSFENLPTMPILSKEKNAWGSGGAIALGAMGAGQPAGGAAAIACNYNIYCGGPIHLLSVPE